LLTKAKILKSRLTCCVSFAEEEVGNQNKLCMQGKVMESCLACYKLQLHSNLK